MHHGTIAAPEALMEPVAAAVAGTPVASVEHLDGARSRHTELVVDHGLAELRARILDAVDGLAPPAAPGPVVVHRYDAGDYTLPRRAGEVVGGSERVLLFPLSGSSVDGVTVWSGERFTRVLDRAGGALLLPADAWVWTSPVRGRCPRYTITMGVT